MDAYQLAAVLGETPIKEIRYLQRTQSTNDEAAEWIKQDAPDLALVVADEQTSGRGRLGRRWYTPPGSALAFSLILRPGAAENVDHHATWLVGLGALAASDGLAEYSLTAEIKWPNDILVGRRKLCGILVESAWQGSVLSGAILGIGVNVSPASVPRDDEIQFPATCVEAELGRKIDRLDLLKKIITRIVYWRDKLGSPAFLENWDQRLVYKGQQVRVIEPGRTYSGELIGLDRDGALLLREGKGEVQRILAGDLQIRAF